MERKTCDNVERHPFVLKSKERRLVEHTVKRLNELDKNNTYNIDKENGIYYVFRVEDEDDI